MLTDITGNKINKVLVYSSELRTKVLVHVSALIATADREGNPWLAIVTSEGDGFVTSYDEVEAIVEGARK